MKVIRGIQNFSPVDEWSFVTIGIFDGVHRGHQRILRHLKKMAGKKGRTVLLTFDPHPVKFFNPKGRFYEISTVLRKVELVSPFDIDYFVVAEFGKSIAGLTPDEFIRDVLVGKLNAKGVVVGYDFYFGKERSGDTEYLRRKGEEFGFQLEVIDPVTYMGSIVSSTRIRRLVLSGRVKEAGLFLGRYFRVQGKVVHGAGRGRSLGFPTANIDFEDTLVPLPGVYAVMVDIDGVLHRGLANVGFNPTFGEKSLRVEVYILDFHRDIYGEEISIRFIDRIRDERKFPSKDELVMQMKRDVLKGKTILEKQYVKEE